MKAPPPYSGEQIPQVAVAAPRDYNPSSQAPPPYSGESAPPVVLASHTGQKASVPAPAYSGNYAPASAPAQVKAPQAQITSSYWIYWGVSFATIITWCFAVAAAADDKWVELEGESMDVKLGKGCNDNLDYADDVCDLYRAAGAFQFLAVIAISIALVVIVIAACMPAPPARRLGLAAGILLIVFSAFQLIASAAMAELVKELNDVLDDIGFGGYDVEFEKGPTFYVSIVGLVFGVVGAIVVMRLRPIATLEKGGPFYNLVRGNTRAVAHTGPAQISGATGHSAAPSSIV